MTSSFPSGHATAAFCAATLLGGGAGWYALAAAVAATRVYVRLHHASDVLAGAAFGRRSRPAGASSQGMRDRGNAAMMVRRPGGPPRRTHDASFAVSFDYRCPFARNAQEAVVDRIARGRDWDVAVPRRSRWTRCTSGGRAARLGTRPRRTGHRRARVGVGHRGARRVPRPLPRLARRRCSPPATTTARSSRKSDVLARDRTSVGLDPDAVAAEVASGRPLATLAAEHTEAVKNYAMFGVPTFVVGERAAFVRLMERDNAGRHRPPARPVRVRPPERVQAHANPEVDGRGVRACGCRTPKR